MVAKTRVCVVAENFAAYQQWLTEHGEAYVQNHGECVFHYLWQEEHLEGLDPHAIVIRAHGWWRNKTKTFLAALYLFTQGDA